MSNLPEIIIAFAEYGLTLPVLIIIVLVYFYGAQQGVFPQFWHKGDGDSEKKMITMRELHAEMQTLRGYFNHETTEKLEEIRETQKEISENVKDINRKHEEYEKFGIRVRKQM